MKKNKKTINILTFEGGAEAGLVSVSILKELRELKGIPDVTKWFDVISGISTGSILASMINSYGGIKKNPLYTLEEIEELYIKLGDKIFNRSLLRKIITADGLLGPKFSSSKKNQLINSVLKDISLSSAKKHMVLPGWNVNKNDAFFFDSVAAKRKPDSDYNMSDVVSATTGTVIFFSPIKVFNKPRTKHQLIGDFALYYSDPSAVLIPYLKAMEPEKYEGVNFNVLRIGTGHLSPTQFNYKEVKDWGALQWLSKGNWMTNRINGGVNITNQILHGYSTINRMLTLNPLSANISHFQANRYVEKEFIEIGKKVVQQKRPEIISFFEGKEPSGGESLFIQNY